MARERILEKAFFRPNTFAPVGQVYRMVSEVGLAQGNEPHYHPTTIEVCYIRRGHLDWWIDATAHEIRPGDVVVMGAGIPHGSIDSTLQPCEYYSVHLDPGGFPREAQSAFEEPWFSGHYPSHAEAGELVQRVFQEHAAGDDLSRITCRSLCDLLVTSLIRHHSRRHQSRPSPLVRQAQKALFDVADPLRTVEEVAASLDVSAVWLTERFRRETGESPGRWVQTRKISEAKRLLVSGGKSITEISLILGFTSTQYFATAFRRQTGMTPSDYRARRVRTWGVGHGVTAQCAPI